MAHRPVARSHEPVRYLHECKKKKEKQKKSKEKEKIKQSRRNTSIRVFVLVPVRRARILFMSCTLSLPISAIFVRVFLSRMGKHRTYGNTCIVFHPTDRSTHHPFHSPFSYPIRIQSSLSNALLLPSPRAGPRSFPFDRARINRLTGISPRESRTGKRYNRKSKEYRVGGREEGRERER